MSIAKSTDFLLGCKSLYLLGIHPFDFSKSHSPEYKQTIELGKELITENGLQSFAGFVCEGQYRISLWAALITLEFGKPNPNEILEISGSETVLNACIREIENGEIGDLPTKILENEKEWVAKMKLRYNTSP